MTTWAPSKRARSERIEAEADGLIRDLGDRAYQEARRREHEASSDAIAEDWALVAKAIARKTGTRVGLNLSNSTGYEHLLRAGSRAGRGPQGATPSRAGIGTTNRRRPAFPRPNRSASSSWAQEPIPRLRSCAKTRSAPPMSPPRSSPPRSPHGRPAPSRCAFSIAKGARCSAGRKPPADKDERRSAHSAAAAVSRSRTSKISNSSLSPRSCEDRGVVR